MKRQKYKFYFSSAKSKLIFSLQKWLTEFTLQLSQMATLPILPVPLRRPSIPKPPRSRRNFLLRRRRTKCTTRIASLTDQLQLPTTDTIAAVAPAAGASASVVSGHSSSSAPSSSSPQSPAPVSTSYSVQNLRHSPFPHSKSSNSNSPLPPTTLHTSPLSSISHSPLKTLTKSWFTVTIQFP